MMIARRPLLSALLAAPLAYGALGALFPAAGRAQADPQLLAQIEQYLNSLTQLQARFSQSNPDGTTYRGTFYLSRPGRMRLEYDRQPYLYVADGVFLTFYDSQLDSRSDTTIGSTIADFILRENVRLSGDVTVNGFLADQDAIQVDLVQTSDPGAGQLSLIFDRNPLQLRSWITLDAQNQTTRVHLTELNRNVSLPRSLFAAPYPSSQGG